MRVRITNSVNSEKTWNAVTIKNIYYVPENTNVFLYNFWLEFETFEIVQEVLNHLSQENPTCGNRPIGMYVVDDGGYESDNIIPITKSSDFRYSINNENELSIYMEFSSSIEIAGAILARSYKSK